ADGAAPGRPPFLAALVVLEQPHWFRAYFGRLVETMELVQVRRQPARSADLVVLHRAELQQLFGQCEYGVGMALEQCRRLMLGPTQHFLGRRRWRADRAVVKQRVGYILLGQLPRKFALNAEPFQSFVKLGAVFMGVAIAVIVPAPAESSADTDHSMPERIARHDSQRVAAAVIAD